MIYLHRRYNSPLSSINTRSGFQCRNRKDRHLLGQFKPLLQFLYSRLGGNTPLSTHAEKSFLLKNLLVVGPQEHVGSGYRNRIFIQVHLREIREADGNPWLRRSGNGGIEALGEWFWQVTQSQLSFHERHVGDEVRFQQFEKLLRCDVGLL